MSKKLHIDYLDFERQTGKARLAALAAMALKLALKGQKI